MYSDMLTLVDYDKGDRFIAKILKESVTDAYSYNSTSRWAAVEQALQAKTNWLYFEDHSSYWNIRLDIKFPSVFLLNEGNL